MKLDFLIVVVVAMVCGYVGGVAGRPIVDMDHPPMRAPVFAQRTFETWNHPSQENDLSFAVGHHVGGNRTAGSEQNFEIDTFLHAGARSTLVLSGINNLLAEAGSYAAAVSSDSAGGHIAGTIGTWRLHGGQITLAKGAYIGTLIRFDAPPVAGDGLVEERYSFVDRDPQSKHILRGTTTMDVIAFSNGWTLRVDGDGLELRDPRGIVRRF